MTVREALAEWNGIRAGDRVLVARRIHGVRRGQALLIERIYKSTRTRCGVRFTVWTGVENQWCGRGFVDPAQCQKAPARAPLAYDPRRCVYGRSEYVPAPVVEAQVAVTPPTIETPTIETPTIIEPARPPLPGATPEQVLAFRPLRPPGRAA